MLRDTSSVFPDGIGDAALKEFWLQKYPQTLLTVTQPQWVSPASR